MPQSVDATMEYIIKYNEMYAEKMKNKKDGEK